MARASRRESRTGLHHIILRGKSELNVFEQDRDKREFWYIVDNKLEELPQLELVCSYLGNNHFHGILQADCVSMSAFCNKVASSYAKTYNQERERKGTVFQGRFLSEPIEGQEQYRKVKRYLLLHGQKSELKTVMSLDSDPIVLDVPEDLYRQRKYVFRQIAKLQMKKYGIPSFEELKQERELMERVEKEAKKILGNTRDFTRIVREF